MSIPMTAETRATRTKGELHTLRKSGKVPGVVYGKLLAEPTSIALEEKELLALLRSHPNAVLELTIPSAGKQPVMITDIQREPLSRKVLHVDLHQINMNETVKTQVRVEIVGEANGVREGGILQLMLHELDIQCLPGQIPEYIEINVADLDVGSNLLVKDVIAPKDVELLSDADMVVVTILAPQKELTEEEAEDAAVEATEAANRSKEAKMDEVTQS